ncbi:Predicted PurR-regulated permease PerM [Proteiniborus ethanoligenes]|uniref:Predicted PurR-regulated permease PerM n=1 Tax=Proteiniborus ethanoligenes TaxID=415015 RepID=A0A1H3P2V2_9FIRM|nr:AI-2E family transporter [Proteiniborus ethanoligenes]SDY95381.1 Predicted PurR-regulated permease PerM [Proteiniborus ethanoligenes]
MIDIKERKKYLNLLPIIIISIFIFKFVTVPKSFAPYTNLLKPFFWAFGIAYILNPMLLFIEKKFKLKRIWNILIVYTILLCIVTLIITILTPKVAMGLGSLFKEIPKFIKTTEEYFNTHTFNFGILDRLGVTDYLYENLSNILEELAKTINPILNKTIVQLIDITSSITSALTNFALGIVISIYMLKDKDLFKKQSKALMYALFDPTKANRIIEIGRESNTIFSRYLIGKIIDSTIIGILCFIGLAMLRTPYALVFSTIVGVTNMIPYFGPFIGMIPATVVTLFYSPIKALWVLVFIFGLQQFDGLYLGPKILGMQVGLSPFWIITAVILGGGLAGVMGMLLAVPIAAVIKTMLQRYIHNKLESKNIKL